MKIRSATGFSAFKQQINVENTLCPTILKKKITADPDFKLTHAILKKKPIKSVFAQYASTSTAYPIKSTKNTHIWINQQALNDGSQHYA